jgi:hypothetical protein
MSTGPVSITFTLGEAEYLRTAMRIHRRKRLPVYAVVLVVYGYFILRLGDMPLQVLDPRPIGLVVFGVFLVFVSPWFTRRGLAKAFRTNKRLQEEMRFTFSPEGYAITGETFSGDNQWSGLHRVMETKDMFLFYHSTLTMNLVPKRAFKDPIEVEAVRQFMSAVAGLQVKRTN